MHTRHVVHLFLRLLVGVCALLLSAPLAAQRLTPAQAMQRLPQPRLHLAYASDALYAFRSPTGFVLTPTDAAQPALLGYSDECTFDEAQSNPAFRLMLQLIERNLQQRRGICTIVPHVRPDGVQTAVAPLLNNLYHQYAPFNRFCPIVDGDTCVTGCVANAMAEVLNYYDWPVRGNGSHTYTDTLGCGQTLTADFAAHTYDWANILDNYEGTYTTTQANAVARLLLDCGIAVDMRYGTEASAASVVKQPIALVNYFGYDESMQLLYRNFHTQQEWDSIMFTELSEGRPLIAGAWSVASGHSFTVDGYDADGLFHCNFGNPQGAGNAWLNYTFCTPPDWYDKDNPENGFNLLQTLLVNVQPKRTAEPSTQTHVFAFSHLQHIRSHSPATHDIAVYDLANIGWNTHHRRVGIMLKPHPASASDAATSTLLYTYDHSFALEELTDSTYTDTLRITIPDSTPAGTYRIVPVYEDPDDNHFVEARTMIGTPNYLLCHIDADRHTTITTPAEATARLSVSDVTFPDTIYYNTRPQYHFTIHNDGAEYSGRIFITLTPIGSTPEQSSIDYLLCQEGLSIGAGASLQRDFSQTRLYRVGPGTYTLRIYADIDLFSDSVRIIYDDTTHPIIVLRDNPQTSIHSPATDDATIRRYTIDGRQIPPHMPSPSRHQPIIVSDRNGTRKVVE